MCVSFLEKCLYATLFVALWMVTSVMHNLIFVSSFPVDVVIQTRENTVNGVGCSINISN